MIECLHKRTELRVWTIAGGSKQAKSQCLDCGWRAPNAVKLVSDLPPGDVEAYERWFEAGRQWPKPNANQFGFTFDEQKDTML